MSNICEKNHQNLMRGFEDMGSKGHFSAKKGGFGVTKPLGGITKKIWVKITSKMNSAPSHYSECKFFSKI